MKKDKLTMNIKYDKITYKLTKYFYKKIKKNIGNNSD